MTARGSTAATIRVTWSASVTSSSAWPSATTSCPRRAASRATARPSIPPLPRTSKRIGIWKRKVRAGAGAAELEDADLRVVPDHEPERAGLPVPAADRHVAAEKRGLHPPVEVRDRAAVEQDRVLDLGALDRAAGADRRVRADVAVDEPRARADDRRAADRAALEPRAGLDDDAPVAARLDHLALDTPVHRVEDQAVGLEHVLQAPGVLPPAADDVRLDAVAAVDEVLDRVGDLELAAGARADRARRVVDRRREHVDADESEVGLRLGRLLGQPDHPPVVQLRDAVVLGVGNRREQDQGVGGARAER